MGTRSTIALEYADGTIEEVYCRWDGYIDGVGKTLQDHYMDPFKVQQLVSQGAMSSLKESVNDCSFYTKRGEDLVVNCYSNFKDYCNRGRGEEYNYILRQIDGKATWFVTSDTAWKSLEQVILDMEVAEDN